MSNSNNHGGMPPLLLSSDLEQQLSHFIDSDSDSDSYFSDSDSSMASSDCSTASDSDDDDDASVFSHSSEEESSEEEEDDDYLDKVEQEIQLKSMHKILQLDRHNNNRMSRFNATSTSTAGPTQTRRTKRTSMNDSSSTSHTRRPQPVLRDSLVQNLHQRMHNLDQKGTYVQTNARVTMNTHDSGGVEDMDVSKSTTAGHTRTQRTTIKIVGGKTNPIRNPDAAGNQHPQKTLEEDVLKDIANPYNDAFWQDYHWMEVTPQRTAGYSLEVTQAVRAMDMGLLEQFQQDYPESTVDEQSLWNACNAHGESLMHVAARRSNLELLVFCLQHGGSLHLRDDYHKNPLHDACWTRDPNFACLQILLEAAPELLFCKDKRGFTPLQYIPAACYPAWNAFLQQPHVRSMLRLQIQYRGFQSSRQTLEANHKRLQALLEQNGAAHSSSASSRSAFQPQSASWNVSLS